MTTQNPPLNSKHGDKTGFAYLSTYLQIWLSFWLPTNQTAYLPCLTDNQRPSGIKKINNNNSFFL